MLGNISTWSLREALVYSEPTCYIVSFFNKTKGKMHCINVTMQQRMVMQIQHNLVVDGFINFINVVLYCLWYCFVTVVFYHLVMGQR